MAGVLEGNDGHNDTVTVCEIRHRNKIKELSYQCISFFPKECADSGIGGFSGWSGGEGRLGVWSGSGRRSWPVYNDYRGP